VDEVASISVRTKPILQKTATDLSLVLAVCLVVLLQLLQAVRELASLFVGTVTLLDELFAQLRFLFMRGCGESLARRFLGGERVAESFCGLEERRDLRGDVRYLAHAFFLG
jgi:hypothetical protein